MYVCGPTVYSHSHIGHGKSYVTFDVVNRYLRYKGYDVTYVQNITDVGHLVHDADEGEDKIQVEAKREGISPFAVAQMYERSYWEDMDALNILRPDISCRATGHIMEQIELIEKLIDRGYAEYGKLSNRKTEDMEAGARVEVRDEKRHPNDFALWKRADANHLMQWKSPWGMGYPGWHIECSAMSMKYLGESFDIHGGGIENQFPHHECEIAQSECGTGVEPFVRYWMHHNMVTVNGKKMGKSMGNASTLKDILAKFSPLVVRFFILQGHYRSTQEFNEEAIEAARTGLDKLLNTVKRVRDEISRAGDSGPVNTALFAKEKAAFIEAMDDDLNTAIAISVLFDLAKTANTVLESSAGDRISQLRAIDAMLTELGGKVLGIVPEKISDAGAGGNAIDGLMDLVISLRKDARARKDFAASDKIRDELQKVGITLEDSKDKTTWRAGK
jgi:cysteinyl-tRNA synthetase